jgi:uncharacterized protein YxeA
MKKIVSTLLASTLVCSTVFAQVGVPNNNNFVLDANGRPATFVQDGRTYYQVNTATTATSNVAPTYTAPAYNAAPATQNYQAVGTYANQNLTTVPGATYVATGGVPAVAPAAAAYGYNGSNMILYAAGAAMIGVAILASVSRSSSTTSNH